MAPPAGSGKKQQQPSPSKEEARVTKIAEVLSGLEPIRESISQQLGPVVPRRVVTGYTRRRCLAFMETELSIIAAFLKTLTQQHLDGDTRRWMEYYERVFSKLNNVIYEVDPSRRTLLRTRLRRATLSFLLRNRPYPFSRGIARLYYLSEHPYRYKLLLQASPDDHGLAPPQPAADDGDAEASSALPLVGIDRPAKKLIRWLTPREETDKSLKVMSIVGPPGIGKTTLAMEVHNRLKDKITSGGSYYFQCNIMARFSREADRNKLILLQDILSQISDRAALALTSSQSQRKTIKLLLHLVSKHLRDKRYFIIIDDIWDYSDWEKIKGAFPNNNLDSRILITTRVRSLAWACCSDFDDGLVYEMKPLSQVDSERLLLAKAFGRVDDLLMENVQPLCDEILSKCEGIPLFIIGMADLFKEQLQQQQKQKKRKDKNQRTFAIYSEEQDNQLPKWMERALSPSYNDLPYESKLLSVSMSMFPSGYKFKRDRLFFMKWNQDEEAIGDTMSQLMDMNVITRVGADCIHYPDEAEACHCQWYVNHFMQQFLASKSVEMGLFFSASNLNLLGAASSSSTSSSPPPSTSAAIAAGHGGQTSRTPRRLAFHHPNPNVPSLLQKLNLSQTRSLAVSGAVSGIPMEKFINLVVLDLEGWQNLTDDDLLKVCKSKMYFLAYLSIRNTQISKIPPEIKELWSLRVLDASYTQISVELPLQVFKLTCLRHVDLRGTRVRISKLPKKQIVGTRVPLFSLLVGGGEETTNPVETASRVTQDVRHLKDLETLATVDLTENPVSFLRALGDLKWLKELAITWSFRQSTDRECCMALLSSIGRWAYLGSLTIHCGLGCSMEFLGTLSYPPECLEKLKVTGGMFLGVPRWISVPSQYLAFVQITICSITADDLKVLADLAQLRCLVLGLDFTPTEAIMIEDGGFRRLQRLFIHCPMPWLIFEIGAMPNLTYLQLEFAATQEKYTRAPSGIDNIHRITKVALCYGEHYANSPGIKIIVEAVRIQIIKHCNPIDLFINGIEQDDVQASDDITENANTTPSGARSQALHMEATILVQTEITEDES